MQILVRASVSRISLTIDGILSISPETIGISGIMFPIFPALQVKCNNVNVNVPCPEVVNF